MLHPAWYISIDRSYDESWSRFSCYYTREPDFKCSRMYCKKKILLNVTVVRIFHGVRDDFLVTEQLKKTKNLILRTVLHSVKLYIGNQKFVNDNYFSFVQNNVATFFVSNILKKIQAAFSHTWNTRFLLYSDQNCNSYHRK